MMSSNFSNVDQIPPSSLHQGSETRDPSVVFMRPVVNSEKALFYILSELKF